MNAHRLIIKVENNNKKLYVLCMGQENVQRTKEVDKKSTHTHTVIKGTETIFM